jgi:hypothetical protein
MRIRYPGFVIFLTRDPGWKNSDPGSGINITKHCKKKQEDLKVYGYPYHIGVQCFGSGSALDRQAKIVPPPPKGKMEEISCLKSSLLG